MTVNFITINQHETCLSRFVSRRLNCKLDRTFADSAGGEFCFPVADIVAAASFLLFSMRSALTPETVMELFAVSR